MGTTFPVLSPPNFPSPARNRKGIRNVRPTLLLRLLCDDPFARPFLVEALPTDLVSLFQELALSFFLQFSTRPDFAITRDESSFLRTPTGSFFSFDFPYVYLQGSCKWFSSVFNVLAVYGGS